MSNASHDQNHVPSLLGVSSSDGTTTIPIYANPTSHRLLVDLSSTTYSAISGDISVTINALNTGQTLLYTVPAGKTFFPSMVYFYNPVATNIGGSATLGVGTSGSGYANIFSPSSIAFGAEGDYSVSNVTATGTYLTSAFTAGTNIYVDVSVAAIADAYSITVILTGILK